MPAPYLTTDTRWLEDGTNALRQAMQDANAAVALPGPQSIGLKGWSTDPAVCATGQSLTSGTVFCSRIYLTVATQVNNIVCYITAQGATLTGGQNFVGLYSGDGNTLLGSASADAGFAQAASTTFTAAITPVTTGPGSVIVAFLCVGTTPAQVARTNAISALAATPATQAAMRGFVAQTGVTALPASLAGASGTNVVYWCGVS